jgi:hypothetical protein
VRLPRREGGALVLRRILGRRPRSSSSSRSWAEIAAREASRCAASASCSAAPSWPASAPTRASRASISAFGSFMISAGMFRRSWSAACAAAFSSRLTAVRFAKNWSRMIPISSRALRPTGTGPISSARTPISMKRAARSILSGSASRRRIARSLSGAVRNRTGFEHAGSKRPARNSCGRGTSSSAAVSPTRRLTRPSPRTARSGSARRARRGRGRPAASRPRRRGRRARSSRANRGRARPGRRPGGRLRRPVPAADDR